MDVPAAHPCCEDFQGSAGERLVEVGNSDLLHFHHGLHGAVGGSLAIMNSVGVGSSGGRTRGPQSYRGSFLFLVDFAISNPAPRFFTGL
jgi:hypothetical protein